MRVPIDEVVHFDAITSHPTTGAAADADSTPTFDVYEEATDTGLLGATNLTKRTSLTGNYRGTFTASAANGFEAGKWYSAVVSATVNSVAGKAAVLHFFVEPAQAVAGVSLVDAKYLAGAAVTATTSVTFPSACTVATTTGAVGSVTGAVGSVTGAVGSVTGAVGSVTGNVGGLVVGTVAGVTPAIAGDAMALTAGERTTLTASIWNAATSGMTTVGSIGKKLADWSIHSAADVWAVATRVLTAATNITSTGGTTVPQTGDSFAIVNHGTYGNAALNTDLDAIIAYLDTEIAAILEDTGTTLPAQIAALNNLSAAQVNAEVVDVIATDPAAELASVPAANASIKAKITFLAMLARNLQTRTATTAILKADDGTTTVATSTISDDATTFTRTEWV